MKKIIYLGILFFSLIIGFTLFYENNSNKVTYDYASASWSKSYSSLVELNNDSEIIGVVTITGIKNTEYINNKIPLTRFEAKVDYALKGCLTNDEIVITQTGINSGDYVFQIEDDPLMKVGNSYLIFGYENEANTVTILSGPQGRFVYEDDKVTSILLSDEYLSNKQLTNNSRSKQDKANFVQLLNVEFNEVTEEIKRYNE